jgi:bacteriocin biosynthesis cyclodehydratase domain-containing protein
MNAVAGVESVAATTGADLGSVSPRLMHDVSFLRTENGLLFRTEQRMVALNGRAVYELVSALAPVWDGRLTVDEICGLLPESQRVAAQRLMAALLERGVLKATQLEMHVDLAPAVRDRFSSQIGFIAHVAEQPLQRFQSFRQASVSILGRGPVLVAAAEALVRNGLATIGVTPFATADERRRIDAAIADVQSTGVEAGLVAAPLDAAGMPRDVDVAIYASDRAPLADIWKLAEHCWHAGIPLLPSFVFDQRAYIGPLSMPGQIGCWVCAVMRLTARRPADAAARFWRTVRVGDWLAHGRHAVSRPSSYMVGNALAFEVFKHLGAHLTPQTVSGMVIHDVATFENHDAPFLFHPLCPLCSDGSTPPRASTEVSETKEERKPPPSVVGSPLGLFPTFDDEELQQLPLNISRLITPSGPVVSFSQESILDARGVTLRAAVAVHALSSVDTRGLRPAAEALASGELVSPDRHSIFAGGSVDQREQEYWARATSILTQRSVWVPAGAVYPHSALNGGSFEITGAGIGCGWSRDEACQEGLRSALTHEALRAVAIGDQVPTLFDLPLAVEAEPLVTNMLAALEHLAAGRPRFVHLPTWSPTTTVAAVGADEVQIDTGWSLVDAVSRVLIQTVGRVQLPESARAVRGDDLGSLLGDIWPPSNILARATSGDASPSDVSATFDEVKTAMEQRGLDALFVEITPPDVASAMPMVVGRTLVVVSKKEWSHEREASE